MKAFYDPIAANLDEAFSADSRVLRAALHDAFEGVSFDAILDGGGSGEAEGDQEESFEDATGLGLSAEDVGGSSGAVGGADRVRQCVLFSERLLGAPRKLRECPGVLPDRSSVLPGRHPSVPGCSGELREYFRALPDRSWTHRGYKMARQTHSNSLERCLSLDV